MPLDYGDPNKIRLSREKPVSAPQDEATFINPSIESAALGQQELAQSPGPAPSRHADGSPDWSSDPAFSSSPALCPDTEVRR